MLQGRVAGFIESVDALVLTELIFDGAFRDLTGSECVAVLSCLLPCEKSKIKPQLTERLSGLFQTVVNTAHQILDVCNCLVFFGLFCR
jgi:ATP-dependent RNA helicase DOB1